MITLKDFIKDTLDQIADATTEFNDSRGGTVAVDAAVHPSSATREDVGAAGFLMSDMIEGADGTRRFAFSILIDFDVAVTATESETSQASGGLKIVQVFSAEAGATAQETTASVSRVKFRLPLRLSAATSRATEKSVGAAGVTIEPTSTGGRFGGNKGAF